jgi:hypothetical protein
MEKCQVLYHGVLLDGTANLNASSDNRNSPVNAGAPLHTKIYRSGRPSSDLGLVVGSMIKKQDNSNDDIVSALIEIIAEILMNMPGNRGVRVRSLSIIPPGASIPPRVFRLIGEDDRRRLPFERIDSDDFIFIMANLPSNQISATHVEIMQDALHVFIDDRVAIISLHTPVDRIRSHFTVHNRVLDVILKKIKKT